MQRKLISKLLLPLLWGYLFIQCESCSMIGLAIGSAVGACSGDTVRVSPYGLDSIEAGKDITLVLKDEGRRQGPFVGTHRMSLEQYHAIFDSSSTSKGYTKMLAHPLDTVIVCTFKASSAKAELLAYDFDGLLLRGENGMREKYRYASVRSIKFNGQEQSTPAILELLVRYSVPLISSVVIGDASDAGQQESLPLVDIKGIEYRTKGNAPLIGFLVGLAADATYVIVAKPFAPKPPPPAWLSSWHIGD